MAEGRRDDRENTVFTHQVLREHFGDTPLPELVVTMRTFPHRVRADLQVALGEMLDGSASVVHFSGVRRDYSRGLDFGALTSEGNSAPEICPPEFEMIDTGETDPVRRLKQGLWLIDEEGERYAILLSPTDRVIDDAPATRFFVATRNGAAGEVISAHFFKRLEEAVKKSRAYRGKVLSLELGSNFSGRSTGIKVHRLVGVQRADLILPPAIIELLDRNVLGFARRRAALKARGQSVKKGLLFHGPPGTGKTHTIRYLAGALEGHTTLLITAEQVGLLPEYMALARLLQPSVVVIEDADLIARERDAQRGVCAEVMLNKLLNEMDGLQEEAEVIFILTTNRPETLEAALASRPGRVDQAIAFPLPDADSRRKLVEVYARGLKIAEPVVAEIVKRTHGVSAAFIKELVRRALQYRLDRAGEDLDTIALEDVEGALQEILFKGGSLNVKMLGGQAEE